MPKAPTTIMYASVVLRETVRTALMVAILNDLEVELGDTLNVYVKTPNTDKVWTTLGCSFAPTSCVTWMTFFVSTILQMLCYSSDIRPSHSSWYLAVQTCTLAQSCTRPGSRRV